MSGQLIGNRYRVLRKIGEGGMAVVHIAVDEKLGRDVAIKILKERYENHEEIRVRFQHEARAISAFDHPNILKIYDFSGEDSKQLWIVTELIHGRNLAQILETTPSGWLHPIIAASITREICRALTTAHEHGIVHRDVKPENVMITHHGTVKLMDFGIAKIQRITSMTQTGMFMGSPSYMSPEQVRGRDIDHRSDIYSTGVLFYELITGKLPFTGASTADIAMRILSGEYSHPRFIMAGIPDNIDHCITRCMELLPDNRPQSISEVGELLDQMLREMGLESSLQELERCFKDPKAYGDRLARILKVTDSKPAPTAIVNPQAIRFHDAIKSPIPRPDISGENLPVGSQRRDHLLPPRSVPHLSKNPLSPDLIAAHLPERRHQQRVAEKTTRMLTVAEHVQKTKIPPPRYIQPAPAPPAPPTQRASAQAIKYQQRVREQAKPRDMRPISRMVPVAPHRPVHRIRYVIHDNYSGRQSSGLFPKITFGLLLLAAITVVWHGTNRKNSNKPRNNISHQVKPTKQDPRGSKPASQFQPPSIQKQITREKLDVPAIPEKKQDLISETPEKLSATKPQMLDKKPIQTQKIARDKKTVSHTHDHKSATSNPSTVSTKSSVQQQPPSSLTLAAMKPSLNAEPSDDTDIENITQNTRKTPEPIKKSEPSGPTTIAISSMPAAELYIDGKRHGTTNDLGTSSEWIEVTPGSHRVELRRSGFTTRAESITTSGDPRQKFGPYTLQRGDGGAVSKAGSYRLTLATNLPPADVTITNIDSHATQSISLSQSTQTINLDRGIYEVTMNRKGDIRKRRIDLTGAAQQLTFSVEFKDQSH